jgi:hypothetical protein
LRLEWKLFFSNEKFRGRNPNLKKINKKMPSFFFEVGAWIFLSPCHHARHLQQVHWLKIFCRMYGLVVMLTIPRSSPMSLINKIGLEHFRVFWHFWPRENLWNCARKCPKIPSPPLATALNLRKTRLPSSTCFIETLGMTVT